jgi:hypothetical protein
MKRSIFFIILLLAFSIPLIAGDFPKIKGWKPVREAGLYQPDNLWEYINGAAEQFLSYGFEELRVCDISDGTITVTLYIYNMGTPLNAFGIYNSERSENDAPLKIGTEAVVLPPYQCLMLKDMNYIKIDAYEGEIGQSLGVSLLKAVAEVLPGSNDFPDALNALPEKDRIEGSQSYVRESFLGLSELQNCVYAKYKMSNEHIVKIFRIEGDIHRPIESHWKELNSRWKPLGEDPNTLYKKIPYTGYVGAILMDNVILGVAAAESEEDLLKLIEYTAELK